MDSVTLLLEEDLLDHAGHVLREALHNGKSNSNRTGQMPAWYHTMRVYATSSSQE